MGDFAYDVRLVWANCALQRWGLHDQHVMKRLSRYFSAHSTIGPSRTRRLCAKRTAGRSKCLPPPWRFVAPQTGTLPHPACFGRSVTSIHGAHTLERYDMVECFNPVRRSPIYFGGGATRQRQCRQRLEIFVAGIGAAIRVLIEENNMGPASDALRAAACRRSSARRGRRYRPMIVSLACFLMEQIADGEHAREFIGR